MGTNVPQPTLGPIGFIAPTEQAVLTGAMADYNTAFGGNLNPALNTPQGQLASSQAAIIADGNDQFIAYVNNVDPSYSSGRMQDGIGRIYFLERLPAQPTTVTATCTGLSRTSIPTNSLAVAEDGNLYASTEAATIGAGGTVSVPFACVTTGPIACPATTLNVIYQAISGWDTVSNPADGVPGVNVEGRAAFEARRAASVALNAVGVLPAVKANVLQVPGVLDCYATENDTTSPVTITGVTIAANSLYVCVSGGAPLAVATAIWLKKPPGCATTGGTSETVYDNNSGYATPPAYTVNFQTAAPLEIIFAVSLASNLLIPSNATVLIQAAIVAAFLGQDGGPRASIGSTIFASRFYSAVASLGSWAQIRSILIGSANTSAAQFTGIISGSMLTTSATTGTIAIGQTVIGGQVSDGTTITAGSGTSWTISPAPQSVSSEAMVGIVAGLGSIAVNINQEPTLDPANIVVTVS
jgi:uncharacterized phage protein gp47/JayE